MNCMICRVGQTKSGSTTITLERNKTTLVVKNAPAEICENCGEAYIDEQVTVQLLASAEELYLNGTLIDVREFAQKG